LSTDYVSPELSAQIIHAELIRTISQSKYDLAIGICRSADSQVSAFIIIDFEFIYQEVKDCYGGKGNVSVPPPVILKMMLLLILYNVRSERIVWQCAEAGLVDGSKLFMDSSLVDADAFNNSVVNVNKETLKIHLVRSFNELKSRWRRLWRVHIQEYLTSAIQNIMTLMSYRNEPGIAKGCSLPTIKKYSFSFCSRVLNIRNVVDRFLKDSLSTARGYQCFAKRML
jgi:hypothetical protein